MDEWRPIETAPRDGTEFDGWGFAIPDSSLMPPVMPRDNRHSRHTECFWGSRDSHYVQRSGEPHMGKNGWCSRGHDGWSLAMVLTHWMPEPEGPK